MLKKKGRNSLFVDTKLMTPKERDDANFMLNVIWLYRKLGVAETDRRLEQLGTDIGNKKYFSNCFK